MIIRALLPRLIAPSTHAKMTKIIFALIGITHQVAVFICTKMFIIAHLSVLVFAGY